MSMLTKAFGIDPLIAALKARDKVAIAKALADLYRRYAKPAKQEPTRKVAGVPAMSDAEELEFWLDELFGGLKK